MSDLAVRRHRTTEGVVVEVIGDVGLTTADSLRQTIRQARADAPGEALFLDFRQVTFLDSAGLALLVETRKLLASEGQTLHVLVTLGRQPELALKISHFHKILHIVHDLPAQD